MFRRLLLPVFFIVLTLISCAQKHSLVAHQEGTKIVSVYQDGVLIRRYLFPEKVTSFDLNARGVLEVHLESGNVQSVHVWRVKYLLSPKEPKKGAEPAVTQNSPGEGYFRSPSGLYYVRVANRYGPLHVIPAERIEAYRHGSREGIRTFSVKDYPPDADDLRPVHRFHKWISDSVFVFKGLCCGDVKYYRVDLTSNKVRGSFADFDK